MENKILEILNKYKLISLNADGNEDCIHQDDFEQIVDDIINLSNPITTRCKCKTDINCIDDINGYGDSIKWCCKCNDVRN